MIKWLTKFSLPLLLKELIEQSARRRTYLIRVIYVSLFYLTSVTMILPDLNRARQSTVTFLGIGHEIFVSIVALQFAGLYLFMPALTCSVLTVEKERNTLGLLFLTRLSSWVIILEKLLSRLFPMYCLMLCSLPLLAFSISLGGVNFDDILSAVWYLSLSTFQIAAIAVACSSFFRATSSALIACYAAMFLLGFGLPLLDSIFFHQALRHTIRETALKMSGVSTSQVGVVDYYSESIMFCFVGFAQFIMHTAEQGRFTVSYVFRFAMGLPLIFSGVLSLLVARYYLVRRAFVTPRNLALILLRKVDRLFHQLNNNRVTRGIVLLDERRSEPDFAPIAWRETHKRSLGQTIYLIRILMLLEIPVILFIMSVIFQIIGDRDGGSTMSAITTFTWVVVTLLITISSAGLISGERGRQTFDILLTLPMEGRRIILDKVAGVRRLMWVCAVPLVTCIVFEAWWRDVLNYWGTGRGQISYVWWEYELTALSMVLIYLPLISWLSIFIGLKTQSSTRATFTSLIAIVAWCIVPLILVTVLWELFLRPSGNMGLAQSGLGVLLLLSPVALLTYAEWEALSDISEVTLLPMFLNGLLYGSICLALRGWILKHADRLVGRARAPAEQVVPAAQTERLVVQTPSFVE